MLQSWEISFCNQNQPKILGPPIIGCSDQLWPNNLFYFEKMLQMASIATPTKPANITTLTCDGHFLFQSANKGLKSSFCNNLYNANFTGSHDFYQFITYSLGELRFCFYYMGGYSDLNTSQEKLQFLCIMKAGMWQALQNGLSNKSIKLIYKDIRHTCNRIKQAQKCAKEYASSHHDINSFNVTFLHQ